MNKKLQVGISLLEVMLSFLLIGVGSLGLIQLQVYMERQASYAVISMDALNLAETQLELFRTGGMSSAAGTYTFEQIISGCNGMSKVSAASHIQLSCSANKLNDLSGAVSTVRMSAYWLDREQKEQSVTLETMISQYNEFNPN